MHRNTPVSVAFLKDEIFCRSTTFKREVNIPLTNFVLIRKTENRPLTGPNRPIELQKKKRGRKPRFLYGVN